MHVLITFVAFSLLHTSFAGESDPLKDPVLACDGCFAMVSELHEHLSNNMHQKLMNRINDGLNGVCSTDKLKRYKFSPPTQVKTCKAVMAKYKTKLRQLLVDGFHGGKSLSINDLTEKFCYQGTSLCPEGFEVPTLVQRREREEWKKQNEEKDKKKEESEDDIEPKKSIVTKKIEL